MKKGILFVLSGPSGTGKGTVVKRVLEQRSDMALSISWTTRPMRPGDEEGVTYFFKTEAEFQQLIDEGGFIEYAGIYGKRYGTPKQYVHEMLRAGRHVLLEIDTQGAISVMKSEPDAVTIFLLPPSMTELKRRLVSRGTESAQKAQERFALAKTEIREAGKYQYCVVNDDLDEAVRQVQAIIGAQTNRSERYQELIEQLEEEVVI